MENLNEALDIDIETMADPNDNDSEAIEQPGESAKVTENSNQQKQKLRLPLSRIKTIMKTDPEVEVVSLEAAFLVTKAAECFIELLAKEAERQLASMKRKTVMKRDVENAIDSIPMLCFLDGALD